MRWLTFNAPVSRLPSIEPQRTPLDGACGPFDDIPQDIGIEARDGNEPARTAFGLAEHGGEFGETSTTSVPAQSDQITISAKNKYTSHGGRPGPS